MRMCNYSFSQKVVAVDTSPLAGDFLTRSSVGTLAELEACCDRLLASGVVDKVIHIDFSEVYHHRVYGKHLHEGIRETHDFRGAPVLGYIFSLEQAQSDYLLHFDTDMLIYQDTNYNWIEDAIDKLRQYPEIACVAPLSGPPTEDGLLYQEVPYERDPRGFYLFKEFTSRKFLVDIKRFENLLPLRTSWMAISKGSNPHHLLEGATNPPAAQRKLDRWEKMVSNQLRETQYYRADLATCSAWDLHSSYSHDHVFVKNLPRIIEKVESGWYPPEQAGHYDLLLQFWL